jgi:ribosome-binding protein aMBF1 (putative translation factor)
LGNISGPRCQALGLPREEVAARLQIDEGTLKKYESGAYRPTSDRIRRLIEAFLQARDGRS